MIQGGDSPRRVRAKPLIRLDFLTRLVGDRMRTAGLVTVFSFLLLWPPGGSADVFRCEGQDGSLSFTNVKESGKKCVRIIAEGAKPRTARAATRTASRPDSAPSASPSREDDPRRRRRYDAHIAEAARLYQLPGEYIRAVVRVESDFVPTAVSRVGALGLMQLMPQTARSMGVTDPFDPRQNILGGSRYLRVLANRFEGDLVLTTAAYNAGGGAVRRYGGIPPFAETQRYVRRVLDHYQRYRAGAFD
jgi:soluble lytic murein transglycosylase-like protein